jgi:PAS domain S-box-containing protein
MKRISAATRISIGLVGLTLALLLAAQFIGLVGGGAWLSPSEAPSLGLVCFMALAEFVAYRCYLGRALRQPVAARTPADQVKRVFDNLTEGIMLLDTQGRIILANEALADMVGTSCADLEGREVAALPWVDEGCRPAGWAPPWTRLLEDRGAQQRDLVDLETASGEIRSLRAHAVILEAADKKPRGILVCLDDVAAAERMNVQIQVTLAELEKAMARADRRQELLEEKALASV